MKDVVEPILKKNERFNFIPKTCVKYFGEIAQ